MKDSIMAKDSVNSYRLESSQQELDLVLNGEYMTAFRAPDYFSLNNSTGHVFDVIKGKGIMRTNVGGDALVGIIKVS